MKVENSIQDAGILNTQKIKMSKKLKHLLQFKICILPADQSGYSLVVRYEYRWWPTKCVWKYCNVIRWYTNWNFGCVPTCSSCRTTWPSRGLPSGAMVTQGCQRPLMVLGKTSYRSTYCIVSPCSLMEYNATGLHVATYRTSAKWQIVINCLQWLKVINCRQ